MSVLYCQSPALFWCALALIVCFFVRRGAHRVRAVLDLVLGLLCIVGGVALYYLGMYNDAFTIRDFWHIRTAGWIGLAAVVLVLCTAGIVFLTSRSDSSQTTVAAETRPTQKPTQATEPATRAQKSTKTTIHIKAAGDLNVTNTVINAGVAVGGYNYTRAFMDVASTLSDADLTVLNLEGNICGEPYGSDTTSAPRELLDGLRNAGVDLIQMANSCTINNGLIGLTSTLQTIRAAGLEPEGAFASESEFQQSKGYTITEAQGVKVAFVAFTKGLGGRGLPAGNDNLVNILYEDYASTYDKIDRTRITSVLKAVEAEKPDITIALLHWGSEYNDDISDTQKSIVNLMKKQGVDVIIGTHPHTVQAIEYDELAGTLVAYSLGDFFGDASRGGTNYSIILDLEITKDSSTGTTKVTNYSYTPIYTVSEAESADGYRRVVRIDKTVEAWEENYLDKVSQSAKESMVYALDRIEARINPPVVEKKK